MANEKVGKTEKIESLKASHLGRVIDDIDEKLIPAGFRGSSYYLIEPSLPREEGDQQLERLNRELKEDGFNTDLRISSVCKSKLRVDLGKD